MNYIEDSYEAELHNIMFKVQRASKIQCCSDAEQRAGASLQALPAPI